MKILNYLEVHIKYSTYDNSNTFGTNFEQSNKTIECLSIKVNKQWFICENAKTLHFFAKDTWDSTFQIPIKRIIYIETENKTKKVETTPLS